MATVRRSRVAAYATFLFVSTLASDLRAQPPAVWRLVPEARVEGETGHYEFTRILAVVPVADGSVYVADARVQDIRAFDGSGKYRFTVGRAGGGPGEFTRLQSVGLIGDTLWTTDTNLRRVTLFALDGSVLATVPRDPVDRAGASGGGATVNVLGVLPDGMAWGEPGRGPQALAGPELPRDILRMSRGGRVSDTLAVVSTRNTIVSFTDGTEIVFGMQRFSDAPLTIVAPSVRRLYVIDRSVTASTRNASFRVLAISTSGDTLWTRSYRYAARRLAKQAADSFVKSLERSFRGAGATDAQVRNAAFTPNYRAPVSSAFAAADGTLWLRREEDRPNVEYWVIAPDGTLAGSVTIARNITLSAASASSVWGVESDADDVQRVVRYRLTK
ncbi:MAG: 6-bladed beta-propeller [Gemmatimonadota bacterium]